MILVLDIATSLEFWRRIYPIDRAPSAPTTLPHDSIATLEEEVWRLAPPWITAEFLQPCGGKLHVLAFEANARTRSQSHLVHAYASVDSEQSFFALNDHLYIASPEFIFLKASLLLDMPSLIALGDELCGLYGFDRSELRGFRRRSVPLVCKSRMRDYLMMSKGSKGARVALRALSYAVDNSASPMESVDEMLLCLPYRYGGYGLRPPKMNHPVRLDAKAANIARRKTCYADMCWPEAKLDIEHHGGFDHERSEVALSDRARVNGLKEMGYEVIELTAAQVGNIDAFEVLALRAAERLGKRIKAKYRGPIAERVRLRKSLFKWNSLYGAIRP